MSWNFCCGELHTTLDDMSRRQVRWVVAAGDAQVLGRDRDASRSPSSLNQHSTYSNNLDKKSGMLTMISLMIPQQECADPVEELHAVTRCLA